MCPILARLIFLAALAMLGARLAHAQTPEQYPYCSLSNVTGGTNCYYRSRAECGANCIDNPSYTGPAPSQPHARARRRPR